MTLLLNPILDALKAAQNAVADAVHADDEVTVEDQGDHWIFEFIPVQDALGGGARVLVAKDDFRIIKAVRGQ